MRETVRTSILFFGTHLRRSLTSRRTLVCAALVVLPAALAWVLALFARRISSTDIATHLGWLLLLQVVLPILSLLGGTAVVAREIEDRTITFVLTRPVPRAALLLGRWLATAVVLSALLALGSGLMLWAASQSHVVPGPGLTPLDDAGIASESARTLADGVGVPLLQAALIGCVVYSALFAALGVLVEHSMIVGLGYAFVVEGFLANLPGKNQSLTIQYYLRSWIAAHGATAWNRVEGFASTSFESPAGALTTLIVVWLAALAIGAWRIQRREFVLTS
jgi:ABC-2 type transport system permease protein